MKELELLCSMKEVSFDGNDLENMVLSLRLVLLLTLKLASHLGAQNTAGPVLASFFCVVCSSDTQLLTGKSTARLWMLRK